MNNYTPPDSYSLALAQQRTRCASDQLTAFEDHYKRRRLEEISVTRSALDASRPQRRMTAAELNDYRAPDPYAAGLDALRKAIIR